MANFVLRAVSFKAPIEMCRAMHISDFPNYICPGVAQYWGVPLWIRGAQTRWAKYQWGFDTGGHGPIGPRLRYEGPWARPMGSRLRYEGPMVPATMGPRLRYERPWAHVLSYALGPWALGLDTSCPGLMGSGPWAHGPFIWGCCRSGIAKGST